jgi:hypothetical protein
LLIKIADDLDFCRNSQEKLFDEICNLKTEIQHLKDDQKELSTHVIESITTKSSLQPNIVSVETFQKKPKLSGIHQLWWAVSNNNIIIYSVYNFYFKYILIINLLTAGYEGKHAKSILRT